MNPSSPADVLTNTMDRVRDRIRGNLKPHVAVLREQVRSLGKNGTLQRLNEPPAIDPAKFKRILISLLKLLIVVEFVGAFIEGINTNSWSRLGFDLVAGGVLYIMWDRLRLMMQVKKDEIRRKVETSAEQIKLWDALAFSLLWSDEIYKDIPVDRRRLVIISYTLIAIGLAVVFFRIASGLMLLAISGALVMAAVNLLAWVVSLERTERETLETELRLAHDVQVSLMPKEQPHITGFDIAGVSIPAKEVGGDHFDYACHDRDSNMFGLCVFDVSGKGMQAAMSAVFTSGAYQSEVKQSTSPAEILTRLNTSVYTHTKRGNFVAFLLAVLDVQGKTFTFSNAGQMKPLMKTAGTVEWLDCIGVNFPLGMKDDSRYHERTLPLKSGDTLLLLTDGFTEAMNSSKEQFGNERIQEIVEHLDTAGLSSEQIVARLISAVGVHVEDAAQHDDMTMVAVRVL